MPFRGMTIRDQGLTPAGIAREGRLANEAGRGEGDGGGLSLTTGGVKLDNDGHRGGGGMAQKSANLDGVLVVHA